MSYKVLTHAADIGIEVRAPDLAGVFAEAARGLAAIVLGTEPPTADRVEQIDIKAADVEDLLVAFLNECLYRFSSEGLLVVGADLKRVAPTQAEGSLQVVVDPDVSGTEVRAATYQGLAIERMGTGWIARVRFTA